MKMLRYLIWMFLEERDPRMKYSSVMIVDFDPYYTLFSETLECNA
jgi:hypothetical protein